MSDVIGTDEGWEEVQRHLDRSAKVHNPDAVKVTQADRDAAMNPVVSRGYTKRTRAKVLRGDKDEDDLVQAFARHRISTIQRDARREALELLSIISGLEAALKQIAGGHWERFGTEADVDEVPDLSADEAMRLARDALVQAFALKEGTSE